MDRDEAEPETPHAEPMEFKAEPETLMLEVSPLEPSDSSSEVEPKPEQAAQGIPALQLPTPQSEEPAPHPADSASETGSLEAELAPSAESPDAAVAMGESDQDLLREMVATMLPGLVQEAIGDAVRQVLDAELVESARARINAYVVHELPGVAEQAIEKQLELLYDSLTDS